MDIRRFERKAFFVEAVQVTAENMSEVAEWCKGSIEVHNGKNGVEEYVAVDVHRPLNKKQTQAFHTDWVILSNTGWKVYTDRAFKNSFDSTAEVAEVTETGRNVFERNQTDEPVELRVINEPADPITDADEFLKEISGVDEEIAHRDAGTGQYVSEEFAKENPKTTVSEKNARERKQI